MLLSAQSVSDKLSVGGITTFLGIGMTFIVLGLLIGCIFLLKFCLAKLTKFIADREKPAIDNVDVAVEDKVNVEETVTSIIDDNIKQAIAEAITMFSIADDKDKKPHQNIIIKSIVEIE